MPLLAESSSQSFLNREIGIKQLRLHNANCKLKTSKVLVKLILELVSIFPIIFQGKSIMLIKRMTETLEIGERSIGSGK